MSNSTRRHPSDRLLVCAIDGELSTRRAIALDTHLRSCERCRTRFARLADVGEELTRAVRNQPDASASRHSALRDRLRLHIDGRAALRDRSWWFRVRRALGTLPFIQRLAAVAVLLVLSVNIVGRYNSTIQHSISVEMEAGALPIHAVTPGAVGPVNLDALCTGRDV